VNSESILSAKNRLIDTLLRVLEQGNEAHRCCAAQALGALGDRRAVASLMDHAQDSDLDVALDAIDALGKLADPVALPLIQEGFAMSDMPDIKVSAIETIGRLGGEAVVDELIQALRVDFDMVDTGGWDASWDVNRIAVESLGQIGDSRAVAPLVSMLDDDTVVVDEGNILNALVHCQQPGITEVCQRLSQHKLARSRRRAALALGTVNTDTAKNALADALLDDDTDVRTYAARSLAGFSDKAYLIPMFMLLKDQSADVRREAVQLVADLGGERAAERLLGLLEDEDIGVQIAATTALGSMRNRDAVNPLIEKLAASDPKLRTAAVVALGQIGDQRACPSLRTMLLDTAEPEQVRAAIPVALVSMADDEVITSLRVAVADDNRVLRSLSMMALRDLASPAARDVLLAALQGELLAAPVVEQSDDHSAQTILEEQEHADSPEPESSADAEDDQGPLSTLESIARDNAATSDNQPTDVENTSPELTDEVQEFVGIAEKSWQDIQSLKAKTPAPHLDVRYFAARALASFTDEEVINALCSCVQESDPDLQMDVVNSLGQIGDDRAYAPLSGLLEHAEQPLRFAATRALGRLKTEGVHRILIEKLEDKDHFVRLAAAEGLLHFQHEEVRTALREHLLTEQELGVRLACARALPAFDDPEDVDILVQAAFLDGGEQRIEMGAILRQFHPVRATDQLIAILNDPEQSFVHRVSIEALQEIHRAEVAA